MTRSMWVIIFKALQTLHDVEMTHAAFCRMTGSRKDASMTGDDVDIAASTLTSTSTSTSTATSTSPSPYLTPDLHLCNRLLSFFCTHSAWPQLHHMLHIMSSHNITLDMSCRATLVRMYGVYAMYGEVRQLFEQQVEEEEEMDDDIPTPADTLTSVASATDTHAAGEPADTATATGTSTSTSTSTAAATAASTNADTDTDTSTSTPVRHTPRINITFINTCLQALRSKRAGVRESDAVTDTNIDTGTGTDTDTAIDTAPHTSTVTVTATATATATATVTPTIMRDDFGTYASHDAAHAALEHALYIWEWMTSTSTSTSGMTCRCDVMSCDVM